MSDQQTDNGTSRIQFEHGIPIINSRLSEVERKQRETEARDSGYKQEQITLNKKLVNATRMLVVTSVAMGIVAGIQVWYTHRQWKLTSDGLSKMGDQIWAAKDAAYAARKSSDTASQTLSQMQAQTSAQQKAAKAAEGSINVTKASLRARIGITPKEDIAHKLINLEIYNTGRIASGQFEITIHYATVNVPTQFGSVDLRNAIEHHWKRHHFSSIPIGNPYGIAIPFQKASEAELTAGTQSLVISANVTYNDGFREDGEETDTFCTQTVFQIVAKQLFLSPCDGKTVIPKMQQLDGYPNNEDQE